MRHKIMKSVRLSFLLAIITSLWLCAVVRAIATPPYLTEEHLTALRSGEVHQLRAMLDQGLSPNARDARGNTPLMLAAVYGDLGSLGLLLDRGAEVNAVNAAGATALMRASYDYEKTRLLLERGAEVNVRSGLGNTPLMLAARPWNSHRTVELLLRHGADARATNRFGASALMAAVAGGDANTVRLLLKHGADINAQPGVGDGPFIFGGGRSPLMWAAFRGDASILNHLIKAGADVNAEGTMGTPLSQAAWAYQTAAARLLLDHGARVNQASQMDGYTPLHWAASSEEGNSALVELLLRRGADPNRDGGEEVDAFLGIPQTPLMLARRRGETEILQALLRAGATNATPDSINHKTPPTRDLPEQLDLATLRAGIGAAVPPLQESAIFSKQAFVRHASRQDCVSCHQQQLPMAAIGLARQRLVPVDKDAYEQLVNMVKEGDIKDVETDWQPLFHPDPAHTKGYGLLAYAAENLPANEFSDSWVHHLAAIQGKDGQWYNNLPRPPIQTGDIGATALAIHALQRYPLPGRKAELGRQVERARHWLWTANPQNNEGRIYQILGLAWAGESSQKLQPLAQALLTEQRDDGGWAQLPGLASDAYATGQAVYALRVGARLETSHPAVERGLRYLLTTQLADGTWHVQRRAFPFQPTTIRSGFPHGRDSWISAAATSWAVMALSLPDSGESLALKQ